MSMLGSIIRAIASKSIKFNLTFNQSVELLVDVLDAAEYYYSDIEVEEFLLNNAKYMLTQKEGIYDGATYEQIRKFIEQHR
jgi:hypothetical protein